MISLQRATREEMLNLTGWVRDMRYGRDVYNMYNTERDIENSEDCRSGWYIMCR